MNRAPMTQASYDFGRSLIEIVDHVIRARGFYWPIGLAVIDQQGQMLWQTLKTDGAGIIVHYPPVAGALDLALCPPIYSPRRWRRNLQRYVVQPY
jgi:hypothetical protein